MRDKRSYFNSLPHCNYKLEVDYHLDRCEQDCVYFLKVS